MSWLPDKIAMPNEYLTLRNGPDRGGLDNRNFKLEIEIET